jgi:hypothetical protein
MARRAGGDVAASHHIIIIIIIMVSRSFVSLPSALAAGLPYSLVPRSTTYYLSIKE